jgi:hypothetical protein
MTVVLRLRYPYEFIDSKILKPEQFLAVKIEADHRTRLPHGNRNITEYCIVYMKMRSSGQSSWLQIQRYGFDSWALQEKKVVGLERGPLSLVSTTEELLGRNSSGSGLESREYGRRDPLHSPRGTLYPQKLALISPTSGSRSVGIVRSRTQYTEFSCFLVYMKMFLRQI